MIYLATPYSHADAATREARFDMACRIAGAMMRRGEVVFSPIAHSHPIAALCQLPDGWEYWQTQAREWFEACTSLVIARMDGWRESKGIAGEIKLARQMGIPVEFHSVEWLLREQDVPKEHA